MVPLLPEDDLWRDRNYRRLWLAILIGSFGGQVTAISLSLMSAVMLGASPMQLGFLGSFWIAAFVLLSLPLGVWLDGVRKLPVYVAGEAILIATLASIPLACSLGYLGMGYLYGVSFVTGCVSVISGTAAQVVLTRVVMRERLVEAHARNGLATSSAEIVGPGGAGLLIKLAGAPFALLANACLILVGMLLLRGIHIDESQPAKKKGHFWRDLGDGVRFVWETHLLRNLALTTGLWQVFQGAAMVVQVLFATRTLGLVEYQYGLCFSLAGIGTVAASMFVHRLSRHIGPGPCFIAGIAVSAIGWLQLAWAPTDDWGVVSFVTMLLCFSVGTVLIFSNMLALRQAITPSSMLARMTSTMRLMTLLPAGIGGLLGGYLGEHFGLRAAIAFGGLGAAALAALAWRHSSIRRVTSIPKATG